ncbi:PTS sugar transporter subunit IIA [Oceanidesulfovibrio indonesiensis]|uniref:PTS sugar transporter subunit IIA n=1 Tax=Oceanidesulfovibrio indonesiensis TaxID=54767 RepID=A0A7M3MGE5_9BACT|nr:PTS sugar transporter subunit IIA [Oceanidesulfovibrio indonesiensis]TVM18329.1 PTS sugar transporter subunit IIA [Oceanidesulfovibrio indonesiensis]
MRLADYLDKDLLISNIQATEKGAVLAELIAPVSEKIPNLDADKALKVLLEREYLGTTGIGDGIAIPHGKLEDLDEIVLVVGRSPGGVDFEALDFKLCTIFFLVLAPEKVAGMHLRILAHISRLLKEESFRRQFLEAGDKEQLWDLLART